MEKSEYLENLGRVGNICLFSGRFDRPNVGHIVQIRRLLRVFNKVIVPVLDYPEQKYPVQYRVAILKDAVDCNRADVYYNKHHFAKIKKDDLCSYPEFGIYASGNVACLKNMASLGYAVLYVDRAYDYSSSEDHLLGKIRSLLS